MQKTNRNCSLSISEAERGGELLVVLSGEIDHHSAVWVRTEIDERIMRYRPSRTVMDLSGICFMDSSGIGLIMGRHARMQAIGGELCVREPGERIMKIFELAGLDRIVRVERNAEKTKKRRGRV